MNARIDYLLDEALALAVEERSALVIALLDSLEGEGEGADTIGKAWADEIRRRKSALSFGATRAVPWLEARARLSAL